MSSPIWSEYESRLALTQYQYERLPGDGGKHIRIATIHPGFFGDDVHVSLRVEEFQVNSSRPGQSPSIEDKVPYYEALSYCWGLPEQNPGHIFVRNQVPHTTESNLLEASDDGIWNQWLPARKSLLSGLRHLRYEDRLRELWIDAICIDQDDTVQKGPQVAMMGPLYSKAARVLVWLGPGADESSRALALLEKWGSQVEYDARNNTLTLSAQLREKGLSMEEVERNTSVEFTTENTRAVCHLLCREWFERIWVRQEIGLANPSEARVQCGFVIVPWNLFLNGWAVFTHKYRPQENTDLAQKVVDRVEKISGFLKQPEQISLCWLRDYFAYTHCLDPRDRVYAVRSMLEENISKFIQPDYSKTTIEVYQDATIAYLRGDLDGDLSILEQCERHPGWNSPSWVPDWSYHDRTMTVLPQKEATGRILLNEKSWELVEPGVLRVRGVSITRLASIYPFHEEDVSEDIQALLAQENRPVDEVYRAGGTILSAYAQALMGNYFQDNNLSAQSATLPTLEVVQRELLELQGGRLDDFSLGVKNRIRQTCTGRAFLRTTSGLLGVANDSIQPGDEVCAVFGNRRLLVLRPSGGQQYGQYSLVGHCCIPGLENGEGILGPLPQNMRHVYASHKVLANDWPDWFWQNTSTGEVVVEDPRFQDLELDLKDYRQSIAGDAQLPYMPYLNVDSEVMEKFLASRNVHLQAFSLV
ncbi:heterokaryon incompatibility protein-domain-containing protein [Xylaria cubensis]|nr:heterokaryon incompatibility protein-domain-containing protein [Xylaria cubensis]